MSNIIGIDLGTTYTTLARLDEMGTPHIVPNAEGERVTPSAVYLPPGESTIKVGKEAVLMQEDEPAFVVEEVKRKMGDDVQIDVGDRSFSPIEISSMILKKVVQDAEKVHGPITEAVITVPANFEEAQRLATIKAAQLAGLDVKHIVNEPTAAALHYATHQSVAGKVAVYDLGGGTFDITLANVHGAEVEVVTSQGDNYLGGRDFDRAVMDMGHDACLADTDKELFPDADSRTPMHQAAETVKKSLSGKAKAKALFHTKEQQWVGELTRDEFETRIEALVGQTLTAIEVALEDAGWEVGDVDEVLLVGGSTRLPMVKERLKEFFGKEPSQGVNPDEAVALGAAVYAGIKANPEDLTPDQADKMKKVRVQEVTNAFYGTSAFDTQTGKIYNSIVLEKDAQIPCTRTENYQTLADGAQLNCDVTQSAYEERDMDLVKTLATTKLNLPGDAAAGSRVEVTFSFDANNTMTASFYHPDSGKREQLDLDILPVSSKASDGDLLEGFQID